MAADGSSSRKLVTQSLEIWSEACPERLAFLCFDDEIVLIDESFHLIPIDILVSYDWSANFIPGGVQIDTCTSTYSRRQPRDRWHDLDECLCTALMIEYLYLSSSRSVVDYRAADATHATPRFANV